MCRRFISLMSVPPKPGQLRTARACNFLGIAHPIERSASEPAHYIKDVPTRFDTICAAQQWFQFGNLRISPCAALPSKRYMSSLHLCSRMRPRHRWSLWPRLRAGFAVDGAAEFERKSHNE